jgi:serine 3-dehydrogenase (NADP+)
MRSQGGGLIIHIGSVSGRWADFSGAAYQASKHGLVGLAQATMIEERENGIRVSVVFPGLCDTPLLKLRKSPPSPETLAKAMQPEDIASACLFIAKLPARTYVPELIMMPGALQCAGQSVS